MTSNVTFFYLALYYGFPSLVRAGPNQPQHRNQKNQIVLANLWKAHVEAVFSEYERLGKTSLAEQWFDQLYSFAA